MYRREKAIDMPDRDAMRLNPCTARCQTTAIMLPQETASAIFFQLKLKLLTLDSPNLEYLSSALKIVVSILNLKIRFVSRLRHGLMLSCVILATVMVCDLLTYFGSFERRHIHE